MHQNTWTVGGVERPARQRQLREFFDTVYSCLVIPDCYRKTFFMEHLMHSVISG